MKLYDDVIKKTLALFEGIEAKCYPIQTVDWPDLGNNNMVLRSDMAYELGGTGFPGVGCTSITADASFVPKDEILLYGRELSELSADAPYARIAIARVGEDSLGEGNTLYNAIKKIEYTRYHFSPKGFMLRISSINRRETARVEKEALQEGLSFEKIGNLMLQSFHENPKIEAVKLIFVNLEDFPYDTLLDYVKKADGITKTIDHMMKNIIMDCDACSLQEICDEVEGLRELHFAEGANNQQQ